MTAWLCYTWSAIYLFGLLKGSTVVGIFTTRQKQKRHSALAHIVESFTLLNLWIGKTKTHFARRRGESNERRLKSASDKLHLLNEEQIALGVTRLGNDLKQLNAVGIIDRRGKRTATELPTEMKNGNSEMV